VRGPRHARPCWRSLRRSGVLSSLCKDASLAQLYADLPVFMRQSHAERDLEAVGKLVAALEDAPWTL
jgi:hypothetical protein